MQEIIEKCKWIINKYRYGSAFFFFFTFEQSCVAFLTPETYSKGYLLLIV